MKDPLALYKLIILYMLDKVDFPLTKAQVGDFILEHEYTNFITLQSVMAELVESRLVIAQSYRNRTHLKLTKEGSDTIHFFENEIGSGIKKDIDEFFKKNSIEMRNESSIIADYYRTTQGDYAAHLIAKEKETSLIDMTLCVPTEELASSICDNWNNKNQAIYEYLCKELF